NSVTYIGEGAFYECSLLKSPIYNNHVFTHFPKNYSETFAIPDGIESIAGGAFKDCSNLTSVLIPNSVTYIGDDAFGNCSSLTSLTIPDGVKYIGHFAFDGCSSLSALTIPSSVDYIGNYAFSYCNGLNYVTCLPITPPQTGLDPHVHFHLALYVPIGSGDAYRNSQFGQQFEEISEIE
ncbi:MAG: leucine-rich repeat domain-containing protein, partial [Paludibacteraceae bacterium]|nr:leucine-rich repeat domain-containing protein [Paludibacteraceae bacterium]